MTGCGKLESRPYGRRAKWNEWSCHESERERKGWGRKASRQEESGTFHPPPGYLLNRKEKQLPTTIMLASVWLWEMGSSAKTRKLKKVTR
ncbi:hypothetical protein EYF80_013810 [Liparis tanakae]|uniref:Uncharacterized protein n=1 Tax=Liparis tanakae TaxID=230148 RepID=A0A4Z2IDR9_9TELE|nr:hypothetical protein EYF80_013810 [Liparis tanakae]